MKWRLFIFEASEEHKYENCRPVLIDSMHFTDFHRKRANFISSMHAFCNWHASNKLELQEDFKNSFAFHIQSDEETKIVCPLNAQN